VRILTISNIYPPGFIGGYELGASDIVGGLAKRGHDVDVLTSDYFVDDTGSDKGSAGVPMIHRSLECTEPNRSLFDTGTGGWIGGFAVSRNLRQLTGRLVASPPDAVLCFNLAGLGAPSILRLLVANGLRPVVFLMDNIFWQMCSHPARRRFDRMFGVGSWPEETRFLFISQNLREEVETALGKQLSHARIIPGWFDERAMAPPPVERDAPVRFVFASQVAGHKGIYALLDACHELIAQGFDSFVVDIFGAGEVPTVLQRITALRLQDRVRYQGALSKAELMPRLAEYDALLLPSWHREPFGFIVAEAAIAGCIPVITFGIGAAEWFLDGVDCVKTARDPCSLNAAMLRVITMGAEERVQTRRRSQMTALRFFRFESALSGMETALQDTAGSLKHDPRTMEAALSILTQIWRSQPNG
jgi:glycogen synthase